MFHKVIHATVILITAILLVLFPSLTFSADPDCTGADGWPLPMAFVHLKNAGLINNDKVDFTKTKIIRLASEKIGEDLYRQIHHIIFTEKSGNTIEVITSNEASNEECSMSDVDVFVVSQHLGNGTFLKKNEKGKQNNSIPSPPSPQTPPHR